jgi:prepilin-type N-terminal cleavage/methylation domain-containing protein
MRGPSLSRRRSASRGFSLAELLVAILLLSISMLGILAIFDASNRINKSELEIADAQGAVRYGVYQMTRAIRMAGSGGLFVTQAVLNRPDPDLPGINGVPAGTGYDNVPAGVTVTGLSGDVNVRPGTDMIEVRGALFSPLVSFDLSNGCGSCTGSSNVNTAPVTGQPEIGLHVNDDATNRPQFAAIDAYTAGVTAANPMLVMVSDNDDIHGGCSTPFGPQQFAQPPYNVGRITAPTQLIASNTFGAVDFANAQAVEFNSENPADTGTTAVPLSNLRRGGVLDDVIFFIDNTDANHPALAQGIRRGSKFDVTTIADDVEDMQIAYGVDLNGDSRVTRTSAVPTPGPAVTNTDNNASTAPNDDEWAPNAAGELPWTTIQFQSDPAPGTFQHPGLPAAAHCPRLHGVMIALVARSKDPDLTYKGPSAFGLVTMNAPALAVTTTRYRRRVQILRINLRNYAVGI